jgi:tetratricopeptide (TPR) repeat protein
LSAVKDTVSKTQDRSLVNICCRIAPLIGHSKCSCKHYLTKMSWLCHGRRIAVIAFLMSLVPLQSGSAKEETDCMSPTYIQHSSAFPDPTYDELRAQSLVDAGHIEESIPWFLSALSARGAKMRWKLEFDCGQAYEKLGNFSEALKHYGNGHPYYAGPARAELLIKLDRLTEAKELCNQGVIEGRKRQKEYTHQDYDKVLCDWLLRRASVEIRLEQYLDAASDLREAALWFAQDDGDQLRKCVSEYEKLRGHLAGSSGLSIKETQFPAQDKESVFKLLRFFVNTAEPVRVEMLNKQIGSKLKVPGGIWVEPHADQQHDVTPSLEQVDYRATHGYEPGSAWIEVRIGTKRCALSHDTVESLLTGMKRGSSPVYDRFNGFPLTDDESFSLPAGTLILTFGTSGYRVLKKMEWWGNEICDEDPTNAESQCGRSSWFERHGDFENALKHITNAIALSTQNNEQGGRYYETRARLLDKQHQTKSAIADASMSVKTGGLKYIPLEVDLLVKDGQIEAAVDVLKEGIASTKFERERSMFELLSAKLYLQMNHFEAAIESAKQCIGSEEQPDYNQKHRMPSYMGPYFYETERMSAPAYAVKAKAEFGLGRLDEARLDAELAASRFFDIAHVRATTKHFHECP